MLPFLTGQERTTGDDPEQQFVTVLLRVGESHRVYVLALGKSHVKDFQML